MGHPVAQIIEAVAQDGENLYRFRVIPTVRFVCPSRIVKTIQPVLPAVVIQNDHVCRWQGLRRIDKQSVALELPQTRRE